MTGTVNTLVRNAEMKFTKLVKNLFIHGLGELLIYYRDVNNIYLGNVVYEKERLIFKDRGIFTGLNREQLDLTLTPDILGIVCFREIYEWKSLTFYGPDYCAGVELDKKYQQMYSSIKNKKGDRLIDFVGSIYRAYHLLLENNYFPVVLFQQSYTVDGEPGLPIKHLNPQLLRPELAKLVQNKLHEVVQKRFTITPGEYIDQKSKAVELNLAE